MEQVIVKNQSEEYMVNVIRSKRKTMALQVGLDGTVVARVPNRVAKKEVLRFLDSHAAWIGAAIASVISEFVVCLYQFTAAQKLVHTKFDKMDILKILLASTGMAIIVILVETVLKNEIIVIILSCILGVLFYTITTVMMKVKTAGMFVGILKSRIGLE